MPAIQAKNVKVWKIILFFFFHNIKIGDTMDELLPLLLSLIAGLSTLIGTIFIFLKIDINKLTKYSLAVSAGVMICVSIIDLIPESLNLYLTENTKNQTFIFTSIYITIGLTLSIFLDKALPEETKNNKLYKLGIFTMIAIIFHNLPEGIITFLSSSNNITLAVTITIAIALHNIPEGISISVPIYSATKSQKKAFLYTLISAAAEPIGALLALIILKPIITPTIMASLLAITSGIMMHIGTFRLLPTALKYKEKKKTVFFFIIGIIFMLISNLLISE